MIINKDVYQRILKLCGFYTLFIELLYKKKPLRDFADFSKMLYLSCTTILTYIPRSLWFHFIAPRLSQSLNVTFPFKLFKDFHRGEFKLPKSTSHLAIKSLAPTRIRTCYGFIIDYPSLGNGHSRFNCQRKIHRWCFQCETINP